MTDFTADVFEAVEEAITRMLTDRIDRELEMLEGEIQDINFRADMTAAEADRSHRIMDFIQKRREFWGIK